MIDHSNIIMQGMRKRKYRAIIAVAVLVVIVLVLMACMLIFGNTQYSLDVIVRTLLGEEIKGAKFAIMTIRLPRMLAGLLVGISLGIAGNLFQKMLDRKSVV